MIEIRPYDRSSHREAVVAAWNREYPWLVTTPEMLDDYTVNEPAFRPEHALVALENGAPAGFVYYREAFFGGDGGGIHVLVYPQGRKEIGRALIREAESRLRALGCKSVGTGGGGPFYSFPGVPVTHPELLHLFQEEGYQFHGVIYDIFRNVEGYRIPAEVREGLGALAAQGIEVRPGRPGDDAEYLEFMRREFPGGWTWMAERAMNDGGDRGDIIVATQANKVIGFAMISHAGSVYRKTDWSRALCLEKPGALGPIGVAKDCRARRLGISIMAVGVDRLASQLGCKNVVIGCTSKELSVGFYAKLGFIVYQNYYGLSKPLDGGI
jgi:predicted N-acetyltransferase YhbS